jgi:FAD/FMN-containing dehydrogenase
MSDFLMGEWGGRYDLTRLLIGSEGTLGIITEVTLRLQKLPEASTVSSFPSLTDRNNDTFERPAVFFIILKIIKVSPHFR